MEGSSGILGNSLTIIRLGFFLASVWDLGQVPLVLAVGILILPLSLSYGSYWACPVDHCFLLQVSWVPHPLSCHHSPCSNAKASVSPRLVEP